MPAPSPRTARSGLPATAGRLLLHMLCCGLPLLLVSGVSTGITVAAVGGIGGGLAAAGIVAAAVIRLLRGRRAQAVGCSENARPAARGTDHRQQDRPRQPSGARCH